MFLSNRFVSRSCLLAGFGVAGLLLLTPRPAPAQQPGSKLWPANVQGASEVLAVPRSPTPLVLPRTPYSSSLRVEIAKPVVVSAPEVVTIRGPDGTVRSFRLEGGREAIIVRDFSVRPGERLTIRVTPTAPAPRAGG